MPRRDRRFLPEDAARAFCRAKAAFPVRAEERFLEAVAGCWQPPTLQPTPPTYPEGSDMKLAFQCNGYGGPGGIEFPLNAAGGVPASARVLWNTPTIITSGSLMWQSGGKVVWSGIGVVRVLCICCIVCNGAGNYGDLVLGRSDTEIIGFGSVIRDTDTWAGFAYLTGIAQLQPGDWIAVHSQYTTPATPPKPQYKFQFTVFSV